MQGPFCVARVGRMDALAHRWCLRLDVVSSSRLVCDHRAIVVSAQQQVAERAVFFPRR